MAVTSFCRHRRWPTGSAATPSARGRKKSPMRPRGCWTSCGRITPDTADERKRKSGKSASPQEIEAALFAIPCKDLEYHSWLYVGSALHKELGAKGKPLFMKWSATDKARFNAAKCARKWDEEVTKFKKHTIATLFHHAEQYDPEWRERFATRMLPRHDTSAKHQSRRRQC